MLGFHPSEKPISRRAARTFEYRDEMYRLLSSVVGGRDARFFGAGSGH
jgi:hypothetical protein